MKQRLAAVLLTVSLGFAYCGNVAEVPASAKAALSRNPYPNELPGFKFYVKHLAPLRPYYSDRTLVLHVLGSDQGTEWERWRMRIFWVGEGNTVNEHAWAHSITGRLASLNIKPKQPVSMLGVKFPAAFTHTLGGVSEIKVSCDVYEDSFGLQYWLYSGDSAAGKNGDLLEIVYGPSKHAKQEIVGPS
jgi:hypothetical protein